MSQRAMLIGASALGMVSAFLPWVRAPLVGSVAGTEGSDGWIVLGIFGLAALLALTAGARMGGGRRIAILIAGGLGLAIAIWKISDVGSLKAKLPGVIQTGFGLYAMALAGALVVGLSLFKRDA